MAYRVDLTTRASRDLGQIYFDIAARYSKQAAEWFNGLEALILSLREHPSRGSSVPEDPDLRQRFYGAKPYTYRIIYKIDERARLVTVIHIRHGARRHRRVR